MKYLYLNVFFLKKSLKREPKQDECCLHRNRLSLV